MGREYKVTITFKSKVYYVTTNRQEDAKKLAYEEYDTNDDMSSICIQEMITEVIE